MKMKEIGQGRGARPTPDPPMIFLYLNRLFPGSHGNFKYRSLSGQMQYFVHNFPIYFRLTTHITHTRIYSYFVF